MNLISGIFTVTLFLGYILLWYIKRIEMLKTEKVEVNVISKATKPIQHYFGILEKVMTFFLVIIIVVQLFFNENWLISNNLGLIDMFWIKIAGFITGILGLTVCRIAQVTIGKSWRVGIDEHAKPGLITRGIYRYMRNPTYSGLFLMCFGVWLINPTVLFSFWIFAFFLIMEFQVRCEEEYLESKYGNEYVTYRKKTKRYLPMIY